MNSKIIAVWGGSNSGKSTFAINLACALSARDCLVGLISTNLVFGELQIFFGQNVPPEKGLFRALSEDNPNIGEKFVESGESKNLFFLSAPTRYSGLLCDTVTLAQVEQMINAASVAFDILVIDGAAELTNPVSGVGLWLAEKICTLHRPSIAARMWHQGVFRVGTQKSNISRLESGTYNPSLDFLAKVARSLGKEVQVTLK